MDQQAKTAITVQAQIDVPIQTAWKLWTLPEHVAKWNHASDDWHTTRAENDLRTDGRFLYRMEAWDGSMGFDFLGSYTCVSPLEKIQYTLDDDRQVTIVFTALGYQTRVVETFEAETINSIDLQRAGWQAIMDNFKKYAEATEL